MDHSLQVARPKEVHGGVLGEGLVAHTVVPLGRLDALSRLGDDRHADISPPLGLIRLTPRHACGESVCGCSADSSGVPCCRFRPGISHTDPAGAILTTLPMTMVRRVRTAMLAPKAAAPAVGGGGAVLLRAVLPMVPAVGWLRRSGTREPPRRRWRWLRLWEVAAAMGCHPPLIRRAAAVHWMSRHRAT